MTQWTECSYTEACIAQASGAQIQICLTSHHIDGCCWQDRDTVLLDYPMTYGQGHWKFRYSVPTLKSRPDLMPPRALQLAGEVLAFGETKYPDEKWKRMTADDHIAASLRHLLEHLAGNLNDSESTKLHLTHSFVRLGMALERYITQR